MQDGNGDGEDDDKGQKKGSAEPVDGRFPDIVVGRSLASDGCKGEPLLEDDISDQTSSVYKFQAKSRAMRV
jgi:hypothetical protein